MFSFALIFTPGQVPRMGSPFFTFQVLPPFPPSLLSAASRASIAKLSGLRSQGGPFARLMQSLFGVLAKLEATRRSYAQ